MIIKSEGHEHNFVEAPPKKLMLHRHNKKGEDVAVTGYDIIKQRVCKEKVNGKVCGAIQSYDLKRTKV